MWSSIKNQFHRLVLFQITWAVFGAVCTVLGSASGANERSSLGVFSDALVGVLDQGALILAIVAPLLSSGLFWALGRGSHWWSLEARRDAVELAHDAADVGYNVLSFAAFTMFAFAALNIGGHRSDFRRTGLGAEGYAVIYLIIVICLPFLVKDLREAWPLAFPKKLKKPKGP